MKLSLLISRMRGGPERRKSGACGENGFSVLEALVAMAVLAGALLPLLALQGQFVKTTQALERSEQRLSSHEMALAHIGGVNLDMTSSGEIRTVDALISWSAAPFKGPLAARDATGNPTRYRVTLYNVEVEIRYNSGQVETLPLQGLGWHPIGSLFDTL